MAFTPPSHPAVVAPLFWGLSMNEYSLTVPARPDGKPISLDLTVVIRAEQRLHEVAFVNRETAGALMVAFNEGYAESTSLCARLKLEHSLALRDANRRKSVVMLEIAPTRLKELGLVTAKAPSGSADQRQSVLDQDEEYLALMDRADQIEAVFDLVKGKQKVLDNAIWNTRKVVDPGPTKGLTSTSMPTHLPDSVEAGMTIQGGFGPARF